MTFKHKLSVRLALLRDALLLVPVAALFACEEPLELAGRDPVVTPLAASAANVAFRTNLRSALCCARKELIHDV